MKEKIKNVADGTGCTDLVHFAHMGKLSLRWFGPVVWETMLPESYKSITTLEKFKEDIKKWIPDNCECRLCKEYLSKVGFIKTFE